MYIIVISLKYGEAQSVFATLFWPLLPHLIHLSDSFNWPPFLSPPPGTSVSCLVFCTRGIPLPAGLSPASAGPQSAQKELGGGQRYTAPLPTCTLETDEEEEKDKIEENDVPG